MSDLLTNYRGRPQQFLVDQGLADDLYDNLKVYNLVKSAINKNIDISLRLRGNFGHDYDFVSAFIGEHFDYHASRLNGISNQ